jgi:hypothetical protein
MKYQIDVPAPSDGGDMTAYLRENERINRWHQTYNAAVTGLFARDNLSEDVIHLAKEFADTAHGPL